MAELTVMPKTSADTRVGEFLECHARRVAATPPGICPLAAQLELLREGAAQTCGKCTPCADGLPRLAGMLQRVVACEAGPETLAQMRALAELIRDASDCAIGYEAARTLLDGMDAFADEYASHTEQGRCGEGVGQKVPCEALCPAHVDVPAYIALTAQGDYAGAINMIRKDNPFPTACALVCEHPCEQRCRRTLIDAPVNIRGIKKFAVDQLAADKVPTPPAGPDTGRRIAVIGGGPSGLTCAYFLALMGHSVTVFEARAQLGGMLRYGIPAYRFPRERLDEDIRAILGAGRIEVRLNETVGTPEMRAIASEYDATYVAIGAHVGKTLRLPGADAVGVSSAVDLLRGIGDGEVPDFTGKDVVVIGGGNVAMDCARTSVRAGAASVSVVYRRRQEDMTALPSEVESAIAEGVEMLTLASPAEIEVDASGHCRALLARPQMIGPVKRGRPAPMDAVKPQMRIPADVVLVAVGQDVVSEPFEEFGMRATRHCFDATPQLAALPAHAPEGTDSEAAAGQERAAEAAVRGVFVGGDCQTGPSTVIRAVGAGKVAARNIDEYLGYHHKLDCGVTVPPAAANDPTPTGRVNVAERPARERRRDFAGVECEMSPQEAAQECGRCLRCDHFGCGALVDGRIQYA